MPDTTERTILITGATDGLGRALALELASAGHELILHGRSPDKGAALLTEIRERTGNERIGYELADFSSLKDIGSLADRVLARHDRLHVLVNNAGIGAQPERQVSQDGHELTFQVNYLATYVLSCRLAPLLVASAPARIVNVSSAGQAPVDFDDVMLEHDWSGVQAYCQSKLAQISLTVDLAEHLAGTGVTVNALHPATYMPTKMVTVHPQSTVEEGVRNTARLVTGRDGAETTGRYFERGRPARAGLQSYDPEARARLRALSRTLTGVPFPATPGHG
ncbi:SDR family NAD(P)-dependent oxidoreductase [Streptomyces spiralis]|uniref:SDR family NAD(P)-dependent oxidoreductase n=1 Tax=Streptomyces spiralis TaxID=66376 RepID=UPI0033C6B861